VGNDVGSAVGDGGVVDNADEVGVEVQPTFSVEEVLGVGLVIGQEGNSHEQVSCRFVEHLHRVWQYIVLVACRTVE
jgi:hypothetical protein